MNHYGADRVWVSIPRCPVCGADHAEKELTRQDDGTYVGVCRRTRFVMEVGHADR